jgi:hypothetical protein
MVFVQQASKLFLLGINQQFCVWGFFLLFFVGVGGLFFQRFFIFPNKSVVSWDGN